MALTAKIRAFTDSWNDRCHPFAWIKTADDILNKRTVTQSQKRSARMMASTRDRWNADPMLLHRYAVLTFESPLPAVEPWGFTTREDVGVYINSVHGSEPPPPGPVVGPIWIAPYTMPASAPTRIVLHAETTTTYEVVQPSQIRVPDEPRQAAERALQEMAAILGILGESPWTISSPRPYLMLSPDADEERAVIEGTKRVILPSPHVAPPFHGSGLRQPLNVSGLLSDRPDGVLLLGAATRAGGGVAKLHELFRVLENGFGRAGASLIKPLAAFLQSYPNMDLGNTEDEIKFWVNDLRHPATHADLQRSRGVAYDTDVETHLYRIEQAAYDVLFNKATWGRSDVGRLQRWAFSAAQRPDGHAIVTDGAMFRTNFHFDHFGAFPLTEGFLLNAESLPSDWLAGDWYFSDEDWALFGVT